MTKMMPSKVIKPFDVFYKMTTTEFGQSKHYYVCIYSQALDENNKLVNDVYGLMVTTNQKYFDLPNDYNVKTEINGTPCFILCDKLFRFKIEDTMEVKEKKFSRYEMSEITEKLEKFIAEIKRQIGEISK
jgi:hypothetical protein